MTNTNPNKFTRAEMADFYEKLMLYYENKNGLTDEPLSTRAKGYRKLINTMNLTVVRFEKEKELTDAILPEVDFNKSFLWFHDAKSNTLKSLFYLLRNSAAHAHIQRIKHKQLLWYRIEHRYKGKLKLFGCMKKTDFWRFVDEGKNMRISSKKTKKRPSR